MKGTVRPCENSTVNIVILPPDYRVKIEYVLIPNSGEKFLGRSHRAKTTEVRAKKGLCLSAVAFRLAPKPLGGCPHLLPTEGFMNGRARPFAALRLSVSLAS